MSNSNRHDDYLAANGWREWTTHASESHDRTWYKRIATPTQCKLNADKPGMQVCLKQWDFTKYRASSGHVSYRLEIAGECQDDRSITVSTGIGDDELTAVLDSQIEKLRRVWESANG